MILTKTNQSLLGIWWDTLTGSDSKEEDTSDSSDNISTSSECDDD
jgi:hypothetical protein